MNADQLRADGWVEQPNGSWSKSTSPLIISKQSVVPIVQVTKTKKRIRQKSDDGMNKLEREALSWLTTGWSPIPCGLRSHGKRYQLANGVNYTPDFTAYDDNKREVAWEVKGPKAWDDAIVKIKMAAHEWPQVEWWLLWKDDEGHWLFQQVLP